MKKIIIALSLISFSVIACNNNETKTESASAEKTLSKEDSLYNAVVEGHDVGMKKMHMLAARQKQVQQALDSLAKSTKAKLNGVYQQQLESAKEELAQAETSMNLWMDAFLPDTLNNEKEKRVQYLQAEKAKVDKVNELLNSSIQKADSLIKK